MIDIEKDFLTAAMKQETADAVLIILAEELMKSIGEELRNARLARRDPMLIEVSPLEAIILRHHPGLSHLGPIANGSTLTGIPVEMRPSVVLAPSLD